MDSSVERKSRENKAELEGTVVFKSEKTLAVPGDYQVVFESCVLALKDARVRVKSANVQTGIVSGRNYKYRMDVSIQHEAGQCIVTATSEFSGVAITD